MRMVLASASPRRKELLAQIGLQYEVHVSSAEEVITSKVPFEVVEELSFLKAESVAKEELTGEFPFVVIGSDTIVACDGKILGKPKDEAQAAEMLRELSGRKHQVYTGVTVILCKEDCTTENFEKTAVVKTFHEATDVEFFPMSEEEIAGYVATKDPLDKAGAYGIQGFCARYIKGITGDYNTVVGLPIGRLYQELKELLEKEGYIL